MEQNEQIENNDLVMDLTFDFNGLESDFEEMNFDLGLTDI